MLKLHGVILAGVVASALSWTACSKDEPLPVPDQAPMPDQSKMQMPMRAQVTPVGTEQPPTAFSAPQPPGTAATCPVTGSPFKIAAETLSSEYQGKYVYFCCAGCKPKFDADPEKYLAGIPTGAPGSR